MKDFAGKVAVVTGGASGIGLGMATRFAAEGMRLVLADIEEGALEASATGLREGGAEVLAVQTDAGDAASMGRPRRAGAGALRRRPHRL